MVAQIGWDEMRIVLVESYSCDSSDELRRREEYHLLGVLGRADLASLGVDACAALSFALDYFAGGFWWHYVRRCDNDLGRVA